MQIHLTSNNPLQTSGLCTKNVNALKTKGKCHDWAKTKPILFLGVLSFGGCADTRCCLCLMQEPCRGVCSKSCDTYHHISFVAGCLSITPELNASRGLSSENKLAQMAESEGRKNRFQDVADRADIIH